MQVHACNISRSSTLHAMVLPSPKRTMSDLTNAVSAAVVLRGRGGHGEDSDEDSQSPPAPQTYLYESYEYPRRRVHHHHYHRSTTVLTEVVTITTVPITTVVLDSLAAEEQGVVIPESPFPSAPDPKPSEDSTVTAETAPRDTNPSARANPATLVTKTRVGGVAAPSPANDEDMEAAPYPPASLPTNQPPGSISAFPSQYESRYRSLGALLTGECASAAYTLLDDGPTMYYAPFVGCVNNRPGCCPFTPVTMTTARTRRVLKAEATQTTTPSKSAFPRPENEKDATMDGCASDYHSMLGGCCPSGYEPWTSALGNQTPCVSRLTTSTTAPPITAASTSQASAKPTVTMSGVVFAMQYSLQDPEEGGLSAGAIAGITIGCVLGFLAVVGIAILIRRRHKQSRQLSWLKRDLHDNFYGPNAGTSEVPTEARDLTAANLNSQLRAQRSSFSGLARGSAALAKEQRTELPAELCTPDSPDYLYHAVTRRESALTPGPEDYPEELLELPSGGASPIYELSGGPEVQLARPQRLSRGYPRVIYTQSQGQPSTTSVHTDSEGRPGTGSSTGPSTQPSTRPPTRDSLRGADISEERPTTV